MAATLDDMRQMHWNKHDAMPEDAVVRKWFGIAEPNHATGADSVAIGGSDSAANATPDLPHGQHTRDAPVSYWMGERARGALVLGHHDPHPSTEQTWEDMNEEHSRRWWSELGKMPYCVTG